VCVCIYVRTSHLRTRGWAKALSDQLAVDFQFITFQEAFSVRVAKGARGSMESLASPAMGHWSTCPPPIDFQQFISFCFCFGAIQSTTAMSYVKYLQDLRAAVIKISSFFILLKKWKVHIGYFCITVCIMRVTNYFDVVFRRQWMQFCHLKPEEPIAGVGFLEKGQLAPAPPVRGFGERCKLQNPIFL